MKDDVNRFLKFGILIGAIAIILSITIMSKSSKDTIKILLYPTFIFLPVAYVVIRFKLYIAGEFSKKYSKILALIGMVLAMIIAPKLSLIFKAYCAVFGFEIACLFYVILAFGNRNKSVNEKIEK